MALVDGSAELYAQGEIGQNSVDLLGKGIIKNMDSTELLGRADVQQSGSAELWARFEAQATNELLGKGEIRQPGSTEILGKAIIKKISSTNLLARAEIGQDSQGLLGNTKIRHVGTPVEFLGKFDAQAIKDLLGETIIRHPAYPLWLKGTFSVSLTNTYLDLFGYGTVGRSTQRDLAARSVVVHHSVQELSTSFVTSHSRYSDVLGKTMIRHVSSRNLSCNFVTQGFADLVARMTIGPAKDSDIYIAPLDPSGWINEVVGIGQGFIAMPWVEADSVITKGSYSSARLTSTYGPGQYKEIRFGWCGMGWGFEVEGLTPTPIDTDGGGPRRGSRGDQRREVPQEGIIKELGASFSLTRKGFKNLIASFEIDMPPFYDSTWMLSLGINPWATSIGTEWETIMEFYWPLTPQSSDNMLFLWDAQIRAWGPGAEYYVAITFQNDGEEKVMLEPSGTNPNSGWMWDGLAAGIFPIAISRPWIISYGPQWEKPWTVRVEMKSTQPIDVFWQSLNMIMHTRRDWP